MGFPGEGHPPGVRGDPAIGDTGSSPPAPGVHNAKGFVSTDPHPRLRRRLASRGRDNASVDVPPPALSGSKDSLSSGILPGARLHADQGVRANWAVNPPQTTIATRTSHRRLQQRPVLSTRGGLGGQRFAGTWAGGVDLPTANLLRPERVNVNSHNSGLSFGDGRCAGRDHFGRDPGTASCPQARPGPKPTGDQRRGASGVIGTR